MPGTMSSKLMRGTIFTVDFTKSSSHSLQQKNSDDRTGESLKNKLVGAIETRVSMLNSKPNLVVIDEIDGASMAGTGDQNFIRLLMDKVQAGVPGYKGDFLLVAMELFFRRLPDSRQPTLANRNQKVKKRETQERNFTAHYLHLQ
jgi:hypothetical protein